MRANSFQWGATLLAVPFYAGAVGVHTRGTYGMLKLPTVCTSVHLLRAIASTTFRHSLPPNATQWRVTWPLTDMRSPVKNCRATLPQCVGQFRTHQLQILDSAQFPFEGITGRCRRCHTKQPISVVRTSLSCYRSLPSC